MATQLIENPIFQEQDETAQLVDSSDLRSNPFGLLDHRVKVTALHPTDALPGHYLSISDGDGAEHMLELEAAILHVGRAVGADLRFEDMHVSRRHAIIVRYGDHVRVLDDRSSAGTFVNGRRVLATDLADGDVIRIGPVAFTYVRVR